MASEIPNVSNGSVDEKIRFPRTYQVVVAATQEMGICKDGTLPWRLTSDLKFFKEVTLHTSNPEKKNAVVMGRKTWESIPPRHRPLLGRLNVILTRSSEFELEGLENVLACGRMESVLELLGADPYSNRVERVFVIGGGQILRETLNAPACDAIHIKEIGNSLNCDTFIPSVDMSLFRPWYSSLPKVENGIRYSFVTYVRVRKTVSANGTLINSSKSNCSKFEVQDFSFLPQVILERHGEFMYLWLIQEIVSGGNLKSDRTGTGTLSKFGSQMRFSLRKSFPLLTTKRVFWRGVVERLLWFISGSTNAKVLQEKGIHIGMAMHPEIF